MDDKELVLRIEATKWEEPVDKDGVSLAHLRKLEEAFDGMTWPLEMDD